jgi:hypothetical protein
MVIIVKISNILISTSLADMLQSYYLEIFYA